MKYYIVVGEASGDMHAANLMKEIIKQDSDAEFRFCGGDLMLKVSDQLFMHYKENNFFGFLEVILNLKTIKKHIKSVQQDIAQYRPNALVLVDYPGFNLRMAKFAKKIGVATHYYISPKIWAWKEGRIKKIKAYIDHMYCILPFEVDFYQKHHYKVHYVGNPLMDQIKNYQAKLVNQESAKPILALLPGSRKSEIIKIFPIMLAVAQKMDSHEVIVAGAPAIPKSFYSQFMQRDFKIVFDQTYDLLNAANLALVTSGTATLETALFKVPQIVCYKTSNFTYQIIKRLIKIKYISLVNLILNKKAVPELIQDQLNEKAVLELLEQLYNGKRRSEQLEDYHRLIQLMGKDGASFKTAKLICASLNQ